MTRRTGLALMIAAALAVGAAGAVALIVVLVRTADTTPDEHLYAAALCEDRVTHIRVDDTYCPIGDGIDNAGYGWVYQPYPDTRPDIDVVYVGYPIDTHVWVHDRPARVRTTNIDRGRYPARPATTSAAAAGATSAKVVTIAEERRVTGSSTVTRGGLGVSKSARNAEAPKPGRSLDGPAPARAGAAAPKPLPKAPTTRVVVSASTPKVKTGR